MNWLKLIPILQLIPGVVAGIEHIHGDAKSGATKKQLALESLGLAENVATLTVPDSQQTNAQAAGELAQTIIDGVVSNFNAQGWPKQVSVNFAPKASASNWKVIAQG